MNVLNYTRRVESWQPGLVSGSRDQLLGDMLETLCSFWSFTKYGFPFMIASLLIAHLYLYLRYFM